jgi:hypothetical protein
MGQEAVTDSAKVQPVDRVQYQVAGMSRYVGDA